MNIAEMMKNNRKEELKAIYRFIDTADFEELMGIIEEIRCCHDNLLAFNADTSLLAKIESVCLNGEAIQLNIEKDSDSKKE